MQSYWNHLQINIEPTHRAFYKDLLTLLGWSPWHEDENMLGMGVEGKGSFWFSSAPGKHESDYDQLGVNHIGVRVEEQKDVDAVAATHVSLTDEQRNGFVRYFASADGLTVTLSGVDVMFDGEEGLATFTRRDAFRDRDSGKDVQLEVRLSTVVVRQDGRWLMRGVRRS